MASLDAEAILAEISAQLPDDVLKHVVVVGSIAAAWSFRDLPRQQMVATKDVDVLLRPAISATTAASTIGNALMEAGWEPTYPPGVSPATEETEDDALPALRLRPPGRRREWFLELLAAPAADQSANRAWSRFSTNRGDFGLPSFRTMPIAVHAPQHAEHGLRVAHPACMALGNMLSHSIPDRTPISGDAGHGTLRYQKDLGRAVALWWLATRASPDPETEWSDRWRTALASCLPEGVEAGLAKAERGMRALEQDLRPAMSSANRGILASQEPMTLALYDRVYRRLLGLLAELRR